MRVALLLSGMVVVVGLVVGVGALWSMRATAEALDETRFTAQGIPADQLHRLFGVTPQPHTLTWLEGRTLAQAGRFEAVVELTPEQRELLLAPLTTPDAGTPEDDDLLDAVTDEVAALTHASPVAGTLHVTVTDCCTGFARALDSGGRHFVVFAGEGE